MKNFLIKCLVLSLFYSISFYSQNEQKHIDSLVNILPNLKKSTNKIEVLFTLSKLNQKVSLEKSEYFNNKLFELAKKINSKKGFGYYHLNNSYLFYTKGDYEKSKQEAQKAEIYFTQLNERALFLDAVYFYSFSMFFDNRGKQAFDYAYKLANLPIHKKYYQQIAQLNYFLAYYCFSNEDSSAAISHNLIALENYRKVKNELGILKCYYNMTDIYIYSGQYDTAKLYGYKTLNLLNKFKTPVKELQSGLYGTLAKIHLHFKEFEKAKYFCFQSLKINEDLGNNDYIGMNLIMSMDIDYAEDNYTLLFEKAKKVLSISKTEYNIIKSNYYLGVYYNKSKKYDIAKKYLKIAFRKINNDNKNAHRKTYFELACVEENLKNYYAANEALKIYYNLEQKYYTKQIDNRINELQNKFDLKEKNIELNQLKLKQEKNTIELQNQRNFILFFLVLILLSVIIIVILVFTYKINTRKNRLLHLERDKVKEALKERELLLKEIHHRVKNNLQIIIGLLNIEANSKKEIQIDTFIEKAHSRISSMSLIHQSLYENQAFSSIDFNQYIEKLTQQLLHIYGIDKKNNLVKIVSNKIFFDIQTAIPLGLILNELISNTLKYAFIEFDSNSKITIQVEQEGNNHYCLMYTDNGIGYNANNKENNFKGLDLVHLLVLQLNGTIEKLNTTGTQYKIKFKAVSS